MQRTGGQRQKTGQTVACAGVDVFEQAGAAGAAVAAPQLHTGAAIVGGKVELALPAHQIGRACTHRAGPDVAHQAGASGAAVAGPQLGAMHTVMGHKIQLVAHGGEMVR